MCGCGCYGTTGGHGCNPSLLSVKCAEQTNLGIKQRLDTLAVYLRAEPFLGLCGQIDVKGLLAHIFPKEEILTPLRWQPENVLWNLVLPWVALSLQSGWQHFQRGHEIHIIFSLELKTDWLKEKSDVLMYMYRYTDVLYRYSTSVNDILYEKTNQKDVLSFFFFLSLIRPILLFNLMNISTL